MGLLSCYKWLCTHCFHAHWSYWLISSTNDNALRIVGDVITCSLRLPQHLHSYYYEVFDGITELVLITKCDCCWLCSLFNCLDYEVAVRTVTVDVVNVVCFKNMLNFKILKMFHHYHIFFVWYFLLKCMPTLRIPRC